MKVIYLEVSDDRLKALNTLYTDFFQNDYIVYRGDGFEFNQERVKELKNEDPSCSILTNDDQFIDSFYCWEVRADSKDYHNLYFNVGGKLVRVQDTTSKELCYAHNLKKLYERGEIGKEVRNAFI